jgi:hypothetical protein
MKTKFEVPLHHLLDFADALEETELDNKVVGSDKEGNIHVEVTYTRDETEELDQLIDIVGDPDEDDEEGEN